MKKVEALSNFVGSPEENERFGGQIPSNLKEFESKMSQADKDGFRGKITVGSPMIVNKNRAAKLEELGLVKVVGDASEDEISQANEPLKEKKEVGIRDNTGANREKSEVTESGQKVAGTQPAAKPPATPTKKATSRATK